MLDLLLEYIFPFIDGVIDCFTVNLSWNYLCTTFWFLIFIEMPRYYLVDILVVIKKTLFFKNEKRKHDLARAALFIENPLISIIAPGKNEGSHIYKLVGSLNEQTYRNYEIIVVDDGSDDATPFICADLERAGLIKKFFRLPDRGGKASAANYALSFCTGKYIVHLDADSSLDRDALENILIPFYEDPRVKGVGGCVKVRNMHASMCSALQTYEYLKTIQLGRMGMDMLGLYHVISGAFGAFDADTLRELGGWAIGPGLDGDLTQKLRKSGHKVRFAHDAVCLTNVPEKWSALFKQRVRWSRSLVRFRVRKHIDIFKPNSNFSFSNMISNLEGICYDFIFNYIWLLYLIQLIYATTDRLMEIMIVGWLIRLAMTICSFGLTQLVSERAKEERGLFIFLFVSTFYSGYFMRIVRLIAHTGELLWRTSYKDPWNPPKTSIVARTENI